MSRFIFTLFSMYAILCITSSCSIYPSPGENEFSVVPTTNNPAVTLEKAQFLPGARL
jgi:hypothetical protein